MQQEVLDLGICLRQPVRQLLDHAQGDLAVAGGSMDSKVLGSITSTCASSSTVAVAVRGAAVEDRHLAEELARSQCGEDLLCAAHLLGDADEPRADHEHLLARLAFAKEYAPAREIPGEARDQLIFHGHQGKRVKEWRA